MGEKNAINAILNSVEGKVEVGVELGNYQDEILEIINKLRNVFLNHSQIYLNTAATPQNIFLMIIKKHILII